MPVLRIDRRARRDRPDRARGRARRPGRGLDRGPAGGDLRGRHACSRSRSSSATRACAPRGRCRGRRRGRAGLAAGGQDGDPAVPERDARVGRAARAAHRGRRRAARLRAPGRRRGPRPQPLHDAAADDARLGEPRRLHARAARAPRARRRARARRAGRRGDRRRRPAAPAVLARRPAPRAHGRAAVDARADGALQPARPAGRPRCRSGSTRAACRSASRSPPARDRDHVSIAVAVELERGFGGWVPPSR